MTVTRTSSETSIRLGVILLTLATAIIHLQLNFPDPVFMLNGLGYLGLLAALCLPIPRLASYKRLVRWALIGFAALTVFLWILIGERTALGYTTTAIEVVLIALLLVETRRGR